MDPLNTLYHNGGMTVGIPCVFMSFFLENIVQTSIEICIMTAAKSNIRAIKKSFDQFEPPFLQTVLSLC